MAFLRLSPNSVALGANYVKVVGTGCDKNVAQRSRFYVIYDSRPRTLASLLIFSPKNAPSTSFHYFNFIRQVAALITACTQLCTVNCDSTRTPLQNP